MENLRLCNRYKGRGFVLRKGKVYPLLREERGGVRVHQETIEKRVYQALEVISNGTSILCRKEGW